jgi:hypothetical protein
MLQHIERQHLIDARIRPRPRLRKVRDLVGWLANIDGDKPFDAPIIRT